MEVCTIGPWTTDSAADHTDIMSNGDALRTLMQFFWFKDWVCITLHVCI